MLVNPGKMFIINSLLLVAGAYLVAGLVFAIYFLIGGVTRIDEGAKDSNWRFRLIILPGTIVFWPVLLKKWRMVAKNEVK